VLVVPADALGTSFARTLPVLVPGVPVVPWGRLERYQCEMWLEAGAVAVVVQDVIVRPEISADVNPLEEVGRRAASFGQLEATRDREGSWGWSLRKSQLA
jgi:2-keto-3-deoxy-6-phosphogluconate aldolase